MCGTWQKGFEMPNNEQTIENSTNQTGSTLAATTGSCGGGPVYPIRDGNRHDGMSLRDYFAGMALQALIGATTHVTARERGRLNTIESEFIADKAYDFADAMICRRG